MLVTLRSLNQQTFKIEVDPEEKVVDLKKKIEDMKGPTFAVANQKLIYAGKMLSDDIKINGCEIDEAKYVVLMVLQPKATPTTEPTPSVTSTPINGASDSTNGTASSTESSKTTVKIETTGKEGSASTPSAESNLVLGDKFEDMVKQIKEMSCDRVEGENGDVRKGEMYLKKLEDTIGLLKVEIEKTEKILANESHLMNEEINGNLLSSIGKGNLLIAQKLNQFRELCHKNINGNHSEQFSTKNEDLDGFWEMVYIQVEDVLNGFQEIYKLKQNNWIIISNNNESPTSKIPKERSPRKVNGTSKTSPNQQSNLSTRNTARDEMRKQRLREAKLKSQSRLQQMKQSDDDVVIFVPPSNPADLLINNHGSKIES